MKKKNVSLNNQQEHENYKPPHATLLQDRFVLFLDSPGKHRDLCTNIIQKILPQAQIDLIESPEEGEKLSLQTEYDTFIFNFLVSNVSNSNFVKSVLNNPRKPLMVGFYLDIKQMNLEEQINSRPFHKIFELV